MIRNCLLFFCLTVFISCGNKNKIPEGVLTPDKMQAVLWDMIKADAFTAEIVRKDSAKKTADINLKLQQEVFTIHKITRENFYKSYDYYKENPGKLKVILDSMIMQAERYKAKSFTIKSIEGN